MMKTRLMTLVLVAGISGSACVGDEALVYTVGNAYANPEDDCKISDKAILPFGTLDISDVQGSMQNYMAFFLMQTTLTENGAEADSTESSGFPHYGSVNTNKIFLEEAEVSYDFGYAALAPEDRTLDLLPLRFQQPIYTMISDETIAGESGKLKGVGFAVVELMDAGISSALLDDANVGSVGANSRYPVAVNYKVRGRTSGGSRIETSDFVYRLNLCDGCSPGRGSCYPAWQL